MDKLKEYNSILNKLMALNNNQFYSKYIFFIIIAFIIIFMIFNYFMINDILNKYTKINYYNMHKLTQAIDNNIKNYYIAIQKK